MERDFLAAIGNQQAGNGIREESVFFGAGEAAPPPMDWSFGRTPDAAPPLMSFRTAAREENTVPQFSPFDGANTPASRILTRHQRSFGTDSHGSPQYHATHRPQPQLHALNGARVIPVSSPFNHNNPMFRVQSSPNLPNGVLCAASFKQPPFTMNSTVASSTVGVYGTRDAPKPKAAQLTIFYAGSVNVFENVSPEKAQELMYLASRGSLPSSTPVARRPDDAPVFAPTKITVPEVSPAKHMVFHKPQHVSPPASSTSKPITGVLQPTSLPRTDSSSNIDSTVSKSSSPLAVPLISYAPSTQPATLAVSTAAAAIMPRAVPQARKASLARFLEKRKERVTTAAPYSSAKSPLESSDTFGSTSGNERSSCTDIALSSSRDDSLCLGQPRNISFSQESPSTKLQI
jgi:jasmonate ZIM domain-containing protein